MSDWKPVPDWEGLYEVSDTGIVRSVARTVTQRNAYGKLVTVTKHSVIRAPYSDRKQRPWVILYHGDRKEHHSVAALVKQAFGEHA